MLIVNEAGNTYFLLRSVRPTPVQALNDGIMSVHLCYSGL
jgi:hypothetical protein